MNNPYDKLKQEQDLREEIYNERLNILVDELIFEFDNDNDFILEELIARLNIRNEMERDVIKLFKEKYTIVIKDK